MNTVIEKKKDNYELKILLLTAILFFLMSFVVFKIWQMEPKGQNVVAPITLDKPIYILKSYSTALVNQKNGLNASGYNSKLQLFNRFIISLGYKTKYLQEDEISSLEKEDILFVVDAVALSIDAKKSIKIFVENGGNLFFNFTAGYSDEKGEYLGDDFVSQITKLHLSKEKNFIEFKDGIFITQRLLSPLNNKNSGILLSASVYDKVPIYKTPKEIKPDFLISNYNQTAPPLAKDKNDNFSKDEVGVAWHGYYGKGKWYYMNLPVYIFYDSGENLDNYKQIGRAIINFFSSKVVISKYPYMDRENVVFISEDTEYKFENFKRFSDLARRYNTPVTAFIVSSLAESDEHKDMVKEISYNSYVEFASHSHLHKKIIDTNESYVKQETSGTKVILDKFTSGKIEGFRPPREELDELMMQNLQDGGFKYILSKNEQFLYPRFDKKYQNLLIIPRHGTDDFSYLVNLDWNKKQILKQMQKETEFVTGLDGIFTLSVHTHLFAYSSNIEIVESYFKYLSKHPTLKALDGRSILKRVSENKNCELNYSIDENIVTINLKNSGTTSIDNFYLRLFKNPTTEIKSINFDKTKVTLKSKSKEIIDINIKHFKPDSNATITIELEEKELLKL